MAWTKQQENAINARNSSVIVSAAAGSGKTAVLTERLVKLIADPQSGIRADRMIVVTFTNDAASELKKRLDMKLRALINNRPGDTHLLKQQVLLQNARISTINSFCFDLIRDNISNQGITSGFSVLDDTDNKVLKAQAMEELLNYYSNNEYEKISFLYDCFCIKNDQRLAEVISRADNFLASVTLSDKWLDKAVEEYHKDFFDSIYHKRFNEAIIKRLESAKRLADDCCNMIKIIFPDMSVSQAAKSLAQSEEDYDRISNLIEVFKNNRFPDKQETEEAIAFSDLVRVTSKVEHNASLREIYKKKRDKFKKIVTGVIESIESVKSDFSESGKVTEILTEVLRKYKEIVWARKCEKNAISFDDGERLTLDLLADSDKNGNIIQSETAQRTADYYDIIMIDEYQDSNNKEDLIFKLISKNYKLSPEGEPMYGDNVFLVGDVKQSIYRFRLANPKNFLTTLKNSEPYTTESKASNKSVFLNKNFRSSPEVIDFVNYIFGQIMSDKCGDIDYNEDEQLYFGAQEYADSISENRIAHIALINDDPDDEEEESSVILHNTINKEAVYTAEKIVQLLNSGTEVITSDGKKRPCKPSDFSILVRNNNYINIYAEELIKRGIPAKKNEESGYLKSREIAILIDLLRIISNPLLDIPMTAVMTSPMYMFSIAEIAYIKSLDNNLPVFSILRGIVDGSYKECTDMFLIERCRDFLDSLDSFRLDSVTMTLGELISGIYDTTDFISVMQLSSDGEKKRANLRALVQYAKNYESSVAFEGAVGLGGFLRHIDRVMENGDYTQGKISASSGDYVTVQTLHSSKGLEYPFVFIAETSCKFKFDSKIVMCSSDGRIGYILYDPELYRKYKTFQQVMLSDEAEHDTRSEEMRLFYVGLTRAKQQLFINLKCGEKSLKRVKEHIESCVLHGGDIFDIVSGADFFSDWIWASIIRHEKFREAAEKLGLVSDIYGLPDAVFRDNLFTLEFAEVNTDLFSSDTEEIQEAASDSVICEELKKIISDNYDRSLSEMPAKLSVTQITKKFKDEDEIFDFKLKRPKFKSADSILTGAERGTAIHTFFQYCDFEIVQQDPHSEIKRVTEMGYITVPQAESLNVLNILAFFENKLYRRIKNADHVWREKKFMVAAAQLDIKAELMNVLKKSDGMIKGIIDLMFEENNELVIVDYKSDRGVSEQKLAERYNVQLQLYKSAIELIMNKKVKSAYLYSFELKKAIPVEFI